MLDLRRHLGVGLVAERLCVSGVTVRRWIRSGKLPAVVRGSRMLVHPDDVAAFIRSARVEARPTLGAEGGAAEALRSLGVG
jgi:excisionase family DNA binding protein